MDAEALHRRPDKSTGQVQAVGRIHSKPAQLSRSGAKRQMHKSRCGGKGSAAPPHIKGEFPDHHAFRKGGRDGIGDFCTPHHTPIYDGGLKAPIPAGYRAVADISRYPQSLAVVLNGN